MNIPEVASNDIYIWENLLLVFMFSHFFNFIDLSIFLNSLYNTLSVCVFTLPKFRLNRLKLSIQPFLYPIDPNISI